MNVEQRNKIAEAQGFIAALDQSGGSTPKALENYGIGADAYSSEAEMFDLIHDMRCRIITSPSFGGDRLLAAILFERTMDSEIEGVPSAAYLWEQKGVVPFLKIDDGLAAEANEVQLLKPIGGLGERLERAKAKGIFGTKMRSVITAANEEGVKAVVAQQFDIALEILDADLVPIIEPEVSINSASKSKSELMLRDAIFERLQELGSEQKVMFKLTLPDADGHYDELVEHENVLRVAALSGGYSRVDANRQLANQRGMVASFSRALTEGLNATQNQAEFDAALNDSIGSIFEASIT